MSFDHMETASWRGIEFEVQTVRDSLMNRLVPHVFPYRDGARHHNMGREARPTSFTAVFMGEDYETRFGELLLNVAGGKYGTFTHPLYGKWTAYVQIPDIGLTHEERDVITTQIDVIEEGLDSEVEATFTTETLSNDLTAQSIIIAAKQALLTAVAMKNQIDSKVANVQAKILQVKAAVTSSTSDMDRKMNDLRRATKDAVELIEGNHPPATAGQMRRAMQVAVYKADKLARAAKVGKPRIVKHEQRIEGPLALVAFQYTGDPDKMAEFMRINRIRNPLRISAGTQLSVFREDPDDQ